MDAPFPPEMMPCIEAFFKDVHPHLTPGLDLYPEVFETSLFFPLQRKEEMRRMIQIARSINPRTVMEIGADKGGGVYHWCQCLPTIERMVVNEIRGVPYLKVFQDNFDHLGFCWFDGGSRDREVLNLAYSYLKRDPIDVLFIDGDKTKMVEDFDAYLSLMNKQKGIVFIHDVQDREPKKAFETIRDRGYRTEIILDTREVWESIHREQLGQLPLNTHDQWLRHWKGRSAGVGVVYVGEKH